MTTEEVYQLLEGVGDPEVPVLSILDLGIVRDVAIRDNSGVEEIVITITPTYSGCPAMDVLAMGIRMALAGGTGKRKITIEQQISPAWTTDWMSENGKKKLLEYGIAPPVRKSASKQGLFDEDSVCCPRCGSSNTTLISNFGPTACKAMYKCTSCLEPFEHFKCH